MSVRFALAADREHVEAFAKEHPAIKDFVFTWHRWGNWLTNPPMIFVPEEGGLGGFHAATFSQRTGYVNSYYIAVAATMRGRGVGGHLIDAALRHARALGLTRLKFKCHKDSPGVQFWEGFGVRRFGEDPVQYVYDVDIRPVGNISSFVEWLRNSKLHAPPPATALRRYEQNGVRVLP